MTNRGKCLIVEDSTFQGKIFENMLTSMGFQCSVVSGGRDGLAELEVNPDYTFVLSDIDMPGMSGLDLLSATRQNRRLKGLPFLMVTTNTARQTVVKAASLGCQGFLRKPITVEALTRKVDELFGAPQKTRVLLVDDNQRECYRLKKTLASSGFELSFTHISDSAKDLLRSAPPEILIISLELSPEGGHALLKWVRSESHYDKLPVVILSKSVSEELKEQSLQMGATRHLERTADGLGTILGELTAEGSGRVPMKT